MSEQRAPGTPEPAPAAAGPHENVLERAASLFRRDTAAAAGDVEALLRGHATTLIRVAADILDAEWPGAEPVAGKVLEVALGVAKAAGIAL